MRQSAWSILGVAAAAAAVATATWGMRRSAPEAPSGGSISTGTPAGAASLPWSSKHTKVDDTVARFAARVHADPGATASWTGLGDAYMQKARETADAGYYGRAEQAYKAALKIAPANLSALIGMAWVNGGRHEFEQSIAWSRKALDVDPRSCDAYGLIGDAQVEMGSYPEAYASYQKMLDTHPDLSSYSRGGHLLWLTGNVRKAVWLMAKAIEAGGPYAENTAWCRAQLGLMLFNNGALLAADQTIKAGLKLQPNDYRMLAVMAKIKTAEKDYPAAIDCYKRSIAVVPLHDSLVGLGDLLEFLGKSEEAKQQFALVSTIDKVGRANGVRGGWQMPLYMADHDTDLPGAVKLAETEYAIRKNVYAADTLAWCYYKSGRYTEAGNTIRAALAQKTPEALFRFHAGMIRAKLGDRPGAQLALYQALSLNPAFHPLHAREASDMYRSLGSRPPDSKVLVSSSEAAR